MSATVPTGLGPALAAGKVDNLFSEVVFHIVNVELTPAEVERLRGTLLQYGATQHHGSPSADLKSNLDGLSHVIAATSDFEGFDRAEDQLINIVRPEWVYATQEKRRAPNPKLYSVDPRMIFSGMVVCIASDVPEGEKDALVGGILAMGGLYAGQMSRQVTHVVALSMGPRECQVVSEKQLLCEIVLPHWFDDCLRLARRLDEEAYRLPNPALLHGEQYQLKKISRPDLVTAMHLRPSHLPDFSDEHATARLEELDVFAGKTVLLSQDLELSEHLRSTIEDLVTVGSGKVVSRLQDADTLVCQWREGSDYKQASQDAKTVGNLSWLYHLISHNQWTSPCKRLLHYPFARHGIPGFSDYKLSLSNYSGESRVYLENLAKAAGASFTKAFKTENTHLITAHERSEKVDAAKEWKINIVNHLWLEDCYAQWKICSVNDDKYTRMPPNTNLSGIVGQTAIDREALKTHFFPTIDSAPRYSTALGDSEDEEVEPVHDDDIFMTANADEHAAEQEADAGLVMKAKDGNARAARSIEPATPNGQVKKLNRPSKSERKQMKTPRTSASLMNHDGKENEAPVTTGGRSAKNKAAQVLHSMASDIQLFQREMKRNGGVTHGGRRAKQDVVLDRSPAPKRSASAESGLDSEASEEDEPSLKKAKVTPNMRLLITGWGGGKAHEAKAPLRDIGITLTEDPAKCTHLAASRIVRTKKFVCALAYAPIIVSTSFIEKSLDKHQILDAAQFPLEDTDGEKKFGMSLQKAIERSKSNKRRLFRNMTIYVTKEVSGGYDTFEDIIKANGGQAQMFQGRPGAIASRRASNGDDRDDDDNDDNDGNNAEGSDEASSTLWLVRGESPMDARLGEKFVQMASKAHWRSRVVSTDWLLNSALGQELRAVEDYLLN